MKKYILPIVLLFALFTSVVYADLVIPPNPATVLGPSSVTDGNIAVFDGTSGKLIKDGGAGGVGATTALDNLASTAVNTDIISDTDGTDSLGSTGIRWLKGWFDDLEVTNPIAADITGNAATVTTINGLAPDTATTQSTQASITSAANLATVGTITSGIWQNTVNLLDANGAAPTIDGQIKYDRTTERLEVGDGSGTSEFVKIGTLTDTKHCIWDAAGKEIDCDTTIAGGGDVSKVGTPVNDQIGVWTGDGTIEGTTGFTFDGTNLNLGANADVNYTLTFNADTNDGVIEWDEDNDKFLMDNITATTFVGALTGNSSTATALANSRTIGGVGFDGTANIVPTTIAVTDTTDTTSFVALWESATGDLLPQSDLGITYNAGTAALSTTTFIGALTGQSSTVATIAGLAPDTATTQATQANITTTANLVEVGALDAGSISVNFGNIDNGSSTLDTGLITASAANIDGALVVSVDSAATNAVTDVVNFASTSTGTPAAGIGIGVLFNTETAAGNVEIGGAIRSVTTDVDPTNEDFDMVFYTMLSGDTAAEWLRGKSDLSAVFAGAVTATSFIGAISGTTISASGLITANAGLDVKNGATTQGILQLFEDSDDGTNKTSISTGGALAADVTVALGESTEDFVLTYNDATNTWAGEAAGGGGGNKKVFIQLYESGVALSRNPVDFYSASASDATTTFFGNNWSTPSDFTSLTSVKLYWRTNTASANAVFTFAARACGANEAMDSACSTDSIASTTYGSSGTAGGLNITDITASYNNLTISAGDIIGSGHSRLGADGDDTLGAPLDPYVLVFEYS